MIPNDIINSNNIIKYKKFSKGENNENYDLETFDNQRRVLRFYKSVKTYQKERIVLEKLEGRLQVPKVFKSFAGDRPYVITSFIKGKPFGEIIKSIPINESKAIASLLGTFLAKLHQIKCPELEQIDNTGFFDHIEFCLFRKRESRYFDDDKAERVWEIISKKKNTIEMYLNEKVIIHGDFKSFNVLIEKNVDKTWGLGGVIDWEFSMATSPIYDISSFYTHIERLLPETSEEFLRYFINSYNSNGGKLPTNWPEISNYLNMIMPIHGATHFDPESKSHAGSLVKINQFISNSE